MMANNENLKMNKNLYNLTHKIYIDN